ncbi:MAG: hypothetical protein AAF993_14795 [Pseudomonadota bacterium]
MGLPATALDARALIERATELIDAEDYDLARNYLAPALIDPYLNHAERSRAYYFRGYTFNVQDMPVSALRDYNRALEFNPRNSVALVAVGVAHMLGRGTSRDQVLGYEYFQQAAALEYVPAYFHIGRALLFGTGVDKNVPEARQFLEKAADDGHVSAMNHLAASYRQFNVAQPQPEIAKAWYDKAVNAGSRQALMYLAYMYANGEFSHSGEAQPEQAVDLFQQALDAGLPGAAVNLAHAYLTGEGVARDEKKAFTLYQLAAQSAQPGSFIGLGHVYEFGIGVAQNLQLAQQWYERAAEEGSAQAATRLVSFYLQKADEASHEAAVRWSRLAAQSGDARAQNDYAWLLATSKFAHLRNGTLALDAAHKAVAKNPSAPYLDTLAAAYAEVGDFEQAVVTQQRAIAAIGSHAENDQQALRNDLERRLELYRRNQAWRE